MLADVFGLESGVTTEGWRSFFLYCDHLSSIARNIQLLYTLVCSYWLSLSDVPEIFPERDGNRSISHELH